MKRFASIPSLACALLALAACSDDAMSPLSPAASAPSLNAEAAPAGTLVLFKGSAIPQGFEARVAALGGSVTYAHAGVGFAMVDGLNTESAAQLRGISGVSDVQPDASFSLNRPQQAASAEMGSELSDAIQSQANPAGAARFSYQWNMRSINAPKAWAAGKLGSPNITVAILDTGIDYDAPDLNGLVDLSRSASFVPSDDAITAAYFPIATRSTTTTGTAPTSLRR